MLILHGTWLDGRLHLWGETRPRPGAAGAEPASSVAERARRLPPDLEVHPPSPFDAGAPLLGKVVEALAESQAAARARHVRPSVAWLPTLRQRPVPSQPNFLMPEAASPHGAVKAPPLKPWRVSTLPLSWTELCAVLSACADGAVLGRRLQAGRSLIVWCRLWRLAGALVARQAYIPSIRPAGDRRCESLWLPVLDGDDQRRFMQIARQLPPAAACISREGPAPAALSSPEARLGLARDFLEQAVDRLIRGAVATPLTRGHALKGRHSGAHAAWLASLRTDGRLVRWDNPDELDQLGLTLADWGRPLLLGQTEKGRLLFRLEEPATPDVPGAVWRLKIIVRSERHPRPFPLWNLRHAPPALREFALMAAGQAVALCPFLREHEADEITPEGLTLDTGAAYAFLTHDITVLRAAGFLVEPPDWWQETTTTHPLRLRAEIGDEGMGADDFARLGLDQLVEVNWSLVLGGSTITPESLKTLVAEGRPLIRWQRRWLIVDPEAAGTALREIKERRKRPMTMRDLLTLAIGAGAEGDVPIEAAGFGRKGEMGGLLVRLRGEEPVAPLETPANFNGELRPYQERGLAWMAWLAHWGLGACLADDMGLGKTIQALALFLHERNTGISRPILLVCPLSLIANWRYEAERFAPDLKVLAHCGPDRAPGRMLREAAEQHDLVITSYNLVCRDFPALNRIHWAMVVLDEAQNIKNPATLQSRATRALQADFRLALTGTPVENRVGDLWAIMDFLNPGLLGTWQLFNKRFQRPIRTGIDAGARTALRDITSPFILRRLKRDPAIINDLPDRVESKVFCNLTAEQASLYAGELHRLDAGLGEAEGAARRGLVLATLTRLKQICNHPAHYLHGVEGGGEEDGETLMADAARSGKLQRFDALIEEVVEGGECALVFTQYAVMGRLLQQHLADLMGTEPPFLHGGVPRAAREAMIARFQSEEGPPVFILSLKVGGTGLNLTRANHVFHFDRWWNPAVENQATDRAHRIGQTRNVFIHKFICTGTLEARIDALIDSKSSLAEDVVGSGESWLAHLSNDKLHEVLALSSDALGADEEPLP